MPQGLCDNLDTSRLSLIAIEHLEEEQEYRRQYEAEKAAEALEGTNLKAGSTNPLPTQSSPIMPQLASASDYDSCFKAAKNLAMFNTIKKQPAQVGALEDAAEESNAYSNEKKDLAMELFILAGLGFLFDTEGFPRTLQKYESGTGRKVKEFFEAYFQEMGLTAKDYFENFFRELTAMRKKKTAEEENKLRLEVEAANAGWPWIDCPPKLLLEAPFALNRYNDPIPKDEAQVPGAGIFRLPMKNIQCKLFELDDIAIRKIYGYLFEFHTTAATFASTCQIAFTSMSNMSQHWDMSRPCFGNADAPKRIEPANFIIVSPYRLRDDAVTAVRQMSALVTLTDTLNYWDQKIETLHLHRVPLLMVEVLDLVIPRFGNLRSLGVYRCPLIHVGHTLQLLDMVGRCGEIQAAAQRKPVTPVRLDFWPRFHVGPSEQNTPTSHGSYGVTWDNSELDTRLAIWCIVQKAIEQAKAQGIAQCLTDEASAFRIWVEKICWNVGPTMKAIFEETHSNDPIQLAAIYDFPRTHGRKDLLQFNAGEKGWGRSYECGICRKSTLGIFFSSPDVVRRAIRIANGHTIHKRMHCLGCMLTRYLEDEEDHLKHYEVQLIGNWLRDRVSNSGEVSGPFSNKDNLRFALSPRMANHAETVAELLEKERQKLSGRKCMQKPIPAPAPHSSSNWFSAKPVPPFISAKTTDGKTQETNKEPYGPVNDIPEPPWMVIFK